MARLHVYLVSCFSAIGGFLFGYDIGIMSSVLEMTDFMNLFQPDEWQKGFIVSAFQLGAFIGALLASFAADFRGRRMAIALGSLIFILGAIFQTSSFHLGLLYVGRIISGISIGVLSMIIPLYQSELAPKDIRGRLISLQQLAITFGILVSFWIGYAVIESHMYNGWRLIMGLQIPPALCLLVGALFLPESPRWLLDKRSDTSKARESLARVRGDGKEVDDELQEMQTGIDLEHSLGKGGWKHLFDKNMLYPLSIGVLMQIFQQLTGINAIMYYAPSIFQSVASKEISNLAQGINGIINFLSTFPAIYLVDRIGRKKLLLSGAMGMITCFVIVVGLFGGYSMIDAADKIQFTNKVAGWSAVVFIYLFVVNFAYSWGPIGWILPAEIFPLQHRARAVSITTATNWLGNLIVAQFTPPLLKSIHFYVFLIFSGCLLLATGYIWMWVPETKGKSLEQIEAYFMKKSDGFSDIMALDGNMEDMIIESSDHKDETTKSSTPNMNHASSIVHPHESRRQV